MAKQRIKKDAQLRCDHRFEPIHIGQDQCKKCGLKVEAYREVAMLSPLVCSGDLMERKFPDVLRRSKKQRNIWRHKQRNNRRVLAKSRKSKTSSSKRGV